MALAKQLIFNCLAFFISQNDIFIILKAKILRGYALNCIAKMLQ